MIRWLAVYLLHSTIVYACALLVSRRLRTAAAGEVLWRSAVLLPLASAAAGALWHTGLWTLDIAAVVPALSGDSPAAGAVSAGTPARVFTANVIVTTLWIATGLLLLGRDLVVRAVYLRRLEPRLTAGGRAAVALDRRCRSAGITRPIRLTWSRTVESPVAIRGDEICIPARAVEELGDRELDALIAHELRHIVRRDPLWLQLLAGIESLFFFQPLHRVARRELLRLAEQACDRWAADQIGDPHAMAACLVEVARWTRRRHPAVVAAMAGSGLTARVEHLMEGPCQERPSRVPALAWGGPVVAVVLLVPSIITHGPSARNLRDPAQPSLAAATASGRPAVDDARATRMRSSSTARSNVPETQTPGAGVQPSAEYLAGFEAARRFVAEQDTDRGGKRAIELSLASGATSPATSPRRRLDAAGRAAIERSLAARR